MKEEIKKDWKAVRDKGETEQLNDESMHQQMDDEDEDESGVVAEALNHPSYANLEENLTLSEQKAHDNWEKAVRATAELENVRRRAEREIANAHRYSLEKFANALLPVLDSLEQALQLADKDANNAMHEGLELTTKLFMDVLAKFEVQQIDPVGEIFDPQQHEAMTMQESAEQAPNTIIAVFQKGYKLNDRVIRPARVVVAK